jgi:cell wall-associated NlpC family hydrolase
VISVRRAVAALGAALLLPVTPAAALPTPSPLPPTAGQAQAAKRQADGRVATLRQRIAAGEQRMRALTTTVTRADGAFDTQLRVVAEAKVAESLAAAALADAQRRYDSAREAMVQLAVAAYEGGNSTTAADLFTAPDPAAVLEAAAYRRLNSDFQTQLTAQLHDALAARHRAEADQQEALGAVSRQLDTLAALRTRAASTRGQALATLQALRADMRVAQRSQARADAALAAFLGSWARSDPGQASALNQRYQAIAQSVAGRRLPAGRGRWSAAIGQAAADRAIQWIGTPYAGAGGTATAPTRGVCTGDGAEHDCQVIGFDCSGLVLYAWGPYRSMKHYAATQYVQAGRLHPAVNRLLPGDLVFWSSDGTLAGIHHVAIYVGDGYVVQAPESGDIVRVTPLADVSPGYYGATRPLT